MTADPPNPGLATAAPHTIVEDAIAILLGTLMVAFGIFLYAKAVLLVGGIAGLSLLLHFATGTPFGLAFAIANLPFYVLAWQRMGWLFTAKTVLAVGLVAAFSRLIPHLIDLVAIEPVFASILGGGLTGTGLLILFRHRTGIGGTNILALYLQERTGLRAGWLLLGLDALILGSAIFVIPADHLLLSVLSSAIVNSIVGINHRPDRYLGASRGPAGRRRSAPPPALAVDAEPGSIL